MSTARNNLNVANQITDAALKYPYKRAVVMPYKSFFGRDYKYEHLTFIDLEQRINQFCHRLLKRGVKPGDRVLLFVKPSLDFSTLTFALFKIGAIPVLIDPGMGVKSFLNAVKQVKARVLIGIPKAILLSHIFREKFKSIDIRLCTSFFPFSHNLSFKLKSEISLFDARSQNETDTAAILFTSGGTGIPKGVEYTHGIFIEQTKMLKEEFNLNDQDVDIPGFPLFALFTLAMGMTSCIPDMNPSKPAKADPKRLIKNIMDQGATFVAGSPAIWKNLADYCLMNRITLPSVKYLVMFGAPIPVDMHMKFKKILPNGTTYTPYGATECLPVSNISGIDILSDTSVDSLNGAGTCIGYPLKDVEVRIVKNTIGEMTSSMISALDHFKVGEIIVHSKAVTPKYFHMEQKTKLAKIYDNGKLWHRMGDMGYFDDQGRLWFCGRQSHSFKHDNLNFYPIPIETLFNKLDGVEKSAIVESKVHGPVVIVQKSKRKLAKADLLEHAYSHEKTKMINKFYIHPKLPVDIRHNIKIDRLALKSWVDSQKSKEL